MSLVEWGREFPVSGNIPSVLDSIVHSFRPLRSLVRSLTVIVFLFEDSSLLALPVSFLQSVRNVQDLQAFVSGGGSVPNGVVFKENSVKVVELVSVSDSAPVFFAFKEDFTYDVIATEKDGSLIVREGEQTGLSAEMGEIKRIVVENSVVSALCECDGKIRVFSAKVKCGSPISGWSLQCEVDEVCEVVNQPPCLYVVKSDGVYGCALDEKGLRRFARPLSEVAKGRFVRVRCFSGFYVCDRETLEISRIAGKQRIGMCKLETENRGIQELVALGNRVFALSPHLIEMFDLVTGSLVSSFEQPGTEKWITSVESNFGLVFVGAKCFTVSRTDVAPLINLYTDEKEMLRQMRSVKQSVGTVAAPILIMANRSPYLAAKLMAEDIANECEKPPIPGTLQEKVRPMLMKLNDLLLHKPE